MTVPINPIFTSIDFDYRPSSYFFPMSAAKYLLATIKGTQRRREIKRLIESGNEREIQDWMAHSTLDQKTRQAIGSYHPMFMGGEYLPDLKDGEVEIARLDLASVTSDAISVRARSSGDRIYYHVFDEYEDDYKVTPCWSKQPLSLQRLIRLIETTTDKKHGEKSCGLRFLDEGYREFGFELESQRTFLHVTSVFYPTLESYYDLAIEDWYQQCWNELDHDDEEEEED